MTLMSTELSDGQFKKISRIIYRSCGINLKAGKDALVKARLVKRLRVLGMRNFDEYLELVGSPSGCDELGFMIDEITTNKTSFFRESEHFRYLRDTVFKQITGRRIRFWSAACSSGEEPFSMAIVVKEYMPDITLRDVQILATDISPSMLKNTCNAAYTEETLSDVPAAFVRKYFVEAGNGSARTYHVKEEIKTMVRPALLNLIGSWPMKGPFNVIFCRNVMIYFDRSVRQNLTNRFWDLLEPEGYLFVGHSESLSAISHKFKYIQPAVYRK